MASQVLPSSFNPIVRDRLATWLREAESPSSGKRKHGHSEHVYEWDDAHYLLTWGQDGSMVIALAMPQVQGLAEGKEAVAATYKGVATSMDPPEGFDVAVRVNMLLSRLDQQQRGFWIQELASLRIVVMGNPLRQHFERLINGTCVPASIEEHCTRPGQFFYIQPRQDAVTVTFPMRFSTSFDACVGKAFLDEFVKAREMPVLGMSPSCSYSTSSPHELETQVDPRHLADVNGGYMSFTFIKRHVQGPQMPQVVWSMCSFYYLVSCHLKACKAAMSAKMRLQMTKLRHVLLSKPPTSNAGDQLLYM